MKIAITGGSRGIGKAVTELLQSEGHEVVEFNKSSGHDITDSTHVAKIIKLSSDCDIFINNAYAEFAQVDLLYALWKEWHNKNRLIINIGSQSSIGVHNNVWPYATHKMALDKASEQLAYKDAPCCVTNVRFGFVGTERIIKLANPKKFIKPEHAAMAIYDQIRWWFNGYRPTEIMLRP